MMPGHCGVWQVGRRMHCGEIPRHMGPGYVETVALVVA
jgi:hypothetical protein